MTTFEKLQRRIGGFPIEYPAAALMAGAVAFCILAVPDWRFESAVTASGLPAILSAAQPPLGTTARILAALAVAALSFAAVLLILRAFDAKPQASDFPAFRAADLHPDAPRRRPILAGAEFGAPAQELPPIEEQLARRTPLASAPLPSFLAPQPPAIGDFMHEPAPAPEYVEIKEDPAPAAPPKPVEPLEVRRTQEPDAPLEIVPERPQVFAEQASVAVPPAAVFVPFQAQEEESVSELMARLESGLSERGSKPLPGPAGAAQEELRRALGDLNRVSGRG